MASLNIGEPLPQEQPLNMQPVIMQMQPVIANQYQQQLLQIQKQQMMQMMQNIQYDVPANWTSETTHLKYSQQILCCGQNLIYTQTQNLGKIEFRRGGPCKIQCLYCAIPCCCFDCSECKECYNHFEFAYLFQNIPNETCPIEIEMCCLKTALIRYKGTVIGKVEMLVSGLCATSPRVIVKPIDESRAPMILVPIVNCNNRLDMMSGYRCKYPRKIQVIKNGHPFTEIVNTEEPNPCCTMPWSIKNAFYPRGDIHFEPSMKTDEKILLVCGWIIQQAVNSYVI